mgnify:CR=1 FL=1
MGFLWFPRLVVRKERHLPVEGGVDCHTAQVQGALAALQGKQWGIEMAQRPPVKPLKVLTQQRGERHIGGRGRQG